MSEKVLESEFLKLRDTSYLRDISSKERKWDGLLIGVLTVNLKLTFRENRITLITRGFYSRGF